MGKTTIPLTEMVRQWTSIDTATPLLTSLLVKTYSHADLARAATSISRLSAHVTVIVIRAIVAQQPHQITVYPHSAHHPESS